jgi:hypothetical protein
MLIAGKVMSDTDSERPPRRQQPSPRPALPEIVELTIERIPFEPPRYRYVRSAYDGSYEALAFTVRIKGRIDVTRDVTPVLYVGNIGLSHVETLGDGRLRFLAFETEERQFVADAPIAFGWPGEGARREAAKQESRFSYSLVAQQ